MRHLMILAVALVTFSLSAIAAEENYVFENEQQREAFKRLTAELRCPMCQNQNIADSDAMIAHDMRRKVYQLLNQGKSEQQVIDFMKSRYGDFVHYQPPVTAATIWLWVGPIAFAVVMLAWLMTRKKAVPQTTDVEDKLAKAEAMLERED